MVRHTMGLRELRLKRGLTQQQLADKVGGVTRSRIGEYETGNKPIENMTLGTAIRICDALRISNPRRLLTAEDGDAEEPATEERETL